MYKKSSLSFPAVSVEENTSLFAQERENFLSDQRQNLLGNLSLPQLQPGTVDYFSQQKAKILKTLKLPLPGSPRERDEKKFIEEFGSLPEDYYEWPAISRAKYLQYSFGVGRHRKNLEKKTETQYTKSKIHRWEKIAKEFSLRGHLHKDYVWYLSKTGKRVYGKIESISPAKNEVIFMPKERTLPNFSLDIDTFLEGYKKANSLPEPKVKKVISLNDVQKKKHPVEEDTSLPPRVIFDGSGEQKKVHWDGEKIPGKVVWDGKKLYKKY